MNRRNFIKSLIVIPAAFNLSSESYADSLQIDNSMDGIGKHHILFVYRDGYKEIIRASIGVDGQPVLNSKSAYMATYIKDLDTGKVIKKTDKDYDTIGADIVSKSKYSKTISI